jgi:hypothetical protein
MMETRLTLPQIGLIAGTRGALGAGLGLLLGGRLDRNRRNAVGWTLVLIGAISTVPLVLMALRSAGGDAEPEHEGHVPSRPSAAPESRDRTGPEPAVR